MLRPLCRTNADRFSCGHDVFDRSKEDTYAAFISFYKLESLQKLTSASLQNCSIVKTVENVYLLFLYKPTMVQKFSVGSFRPCMTRSSSKLIIVCASCESTFVMIEQVSG